MSWLWNPNLPWKHATPCEEQRPCWKETSCFFHDLTLQANYQAKAVFHCEACWLFNACPDLLCIAGHRLFQHLSYFGRAVKQCTFHDMAGHLHDTTRPSHANPAILPRPWLESQRLVSSQTADLEPHGLSSVAKSRSCCMSCTRCCGASCFCRSETGPFASVASSASSSSSSSSSLFLLFFFLFSPSWVFLIFFVCFFMFSLQVIYSKSSSSSALWYA